MPSGKYGDEQSGLWRAPTTPALSGGKVEGHGAAFSLLLSRKFCPGAQRASVIVAGMAIAARTSSWSSTS